MNKFKFFILALVALPLVFSSCNKDDSISIPVSYVEDGFYVVGEATTIADLQATEADKGLMAAGINENDGQTVRSGMYEKYVALEGGKEFQLILKAGLKETKYGATLALSDVLSGDGEPAIEVYKGALTANGAAMKVATSGLYHIVLDVPLNTIIVAPVEWGVRGQMNGWGFTAFPAPTFDKTAMTYKLTNVIVTMDGGFKFAYGNGWKIELNPAGNPLVKTNTNLGNDGGNDNDPLTAKVAPGGKNIGISRGVYSIELTWNLAKGDIKDGYTVKLTKTGEYKPTYPDVLYMIGADFGDWKWDSDGIVNMVPVNGVEGAFWCINYFTKGAGFKWNSAKDWNGSDFAGLGENIGYEVSGGNAMVAEDGLYMVYVDMAAGKIAIESAKVYGIGDCFGSWDSGLYPFTLKGAAMSITTTAKAELRMYAGSSIATTDWWTREFIILDGNIVYRGNGGDQDRVTVDAGKIVILDFKAGKGTIE